MQRQFTATVFIFHNAKVLLHKHLKLGKWLPPGGHLELNETPPEAARREVREETGLEIVFIEQEHVKVKSDNAVNFERPFLCLLENIPPYKGEIAHQHVDFIYLAKPLEVKGDLGAFRWFSYEELPHAELFPDVAEVLRYLFTNDGAVFLDPAASAHCGPSGKASPSADSSGRPDPAPHNACC